MVHVQVAQAFLVLGVVAALGPQGEPAFPLHEAVFLGPQGIEQVASGSVATHDFVQADEDVLGPLHAEAHGVATEPVGQVGACVGRREDGSAAPDRNR